MTLGPGVEPWPHWWEARLSPLRHPYSLKVCSTSWANFGYQTKKKTLQKPLVLPLIVDINLGHSKQFKSLLNYTTADVIHLSLLSFLQIVAQKHFVCNSVCVCVCGGGGPIFPLPIPFLLVPVSLPFIDCKML